MSKAIAGQMMKSCPKFTEMMVKNPAAIQGVFATIDLLFRQSSSKMWSGAANFVGKSVTNLAGQAAGKGAAGVAGGVAVFTSLLSGLDIGHGLGNMLLNGFNSIKDDERNIIDSLNYLKSNKQDEFTVLCDQLIAKLAGSASYASDNAKRLSTQPTPVVNGDIDEKGLVAIKNLASDIKHIMKSIESIVEVLDILKKKETRNLYIKHSESIFGAVGRGVDATVNFAADLIPKTLGLGEGSKQGDNATGFANSYNHMMDEVGNMSGKLIEIQKAIMPHIQALKQFEEKAKEMQQLIAEANSEQTPAESDAVSNLKGANKVIYDYFTKVASELLKY